MKRYIILITVFLFVLSTAVFADETDFNVVVETKTAKPGDTVEIAVKLENNTGILAMHFDVEYDCEKLELVSCKDKKLLEGGFFSQTTDAYPYVMLWTSAAHTNFTDDGTLAVLTFKVRNNSKSGTAFINLAYEPENIFDIELNNVDIKVQNGGIKIQSDKKIYSSGTGSSSASITPSKPATTPDPQPDTEDKQQAETEVNNSIFMTIGKKEATVFGETKTNDVAPVLFNNRTMFPARFIAEALGANVFWTEDFPDVVRITKDSTEIIIRIGDANASLNGKPVTLDAPAYIENNRTFAPLRFIAESLNAKVVWYNDEQKVEIIK